MTHSAATLFSSLADRIAEDPIQSLRWPEDPKVAAIVAEEFRAHALLCMDLEPDVDDVISALALLCQEPPNPYLTPEERDFRFQRSILLARGLGDLVTPQHVAPGFEVKARAFWGELQKLHLRTEPDPELGLGLRLAEDLQEAWGPIPKQLQEKLESLKFHSSQDPRDLARVALRALDESV